MKALAVPPTAEAAHRAKAAHQECVSTADLLAETGSSAFYSIFDTAPYGMVLADNTGAISAVNREASKMFRYRREEMLGRPIEMLLPERFRASHQHKRDGYAAAPSTRTMGKGRDLTGLRRDGVEFPLEIRLSRVESPQGLMTCASIVDITERQRAQLRLSDANAQLEEFTYVASHDLRSPMRGIANLIEFIREDFAAGDMQATLRNLDRMALRVEAVESMIDDLLIYADAGRRAETVEPICIKSIVSEILELERLPEGFSIHVDVPREHFVGARNPLATVLRNLMANAVGHHDRDVGTIHITSRYVDNHCVIDVIDDGPGIPECARERVFRLFQVLDADKDAGSGLGLPIAQRLVTGHGGELSLHPNIDTARGTRFRILWPRFTRTDLDDQ